MISVPDPGLSGLCSSSGREQSAPLHAGVQMCTGGDLLRKPNKLQGKLFHISIIHRLGGQMY